MANFDRSRNLARNLEMSLADELAGLGPFRGKKQPKNGKENTTRTINQNIEDTNHQRITVKEEVSLSPTEPRKTDCYTFSKELKELEWKNESFVTISDLNKEDVFHFECKCLLENEGLSGNKSYDVSQIKSKHAGETLFLSVGNRLYIFSNDCSTVIGKFEFEKDVDCIEFISDAFILFVGVASGQLYFIDLKQTSPTPALEEPFIVMEIFKPNPTHGPSSTFIDMYFLEATSELYCIAGNGKIKVLSSIHPSGLRTLLDDETLLIEEKKQSVLQSKDGYVVKTLTLAQESKKNDLKMKTLISPANGIKKLPLKNNLIIYDNQELSLYSLRENDFHLIDNVRYGLFPTIEKCVYVSSLDIIVALHSDNLVSLIDRLTMISLNDLFLLKNGENNTNHDKTILDMHVLHSTAHKSAKLALTCSSLQTSSCSVLLFELPSLVFVSEVPCPSNYFVQSDQNLAQLFSLGFNEKGLCISSITLTDPSAVFSDYLKRHEFQAALDYAHGHNLDPVVVYITKALYILENLENDGKFDELFECLNFIDDETLFDFCLNSEVSTLEGAYSLLDFAWNKVNKLIVKEETDKIKLEIGREIKLFGTFALVYGDTEKSQQCQSWKKFRTTKMVDQMKFCIEEGKFDKAFSIWSRHLFDEEMLDGFYDILNSLSLQKLHDKKRPIFSIEGFVTWLEQDVLPFLDCTDKKVFFYRWIEKQILDLEVIQGEKWPQNGLLIVNVVNKAANNVMMSQSNDLTINMEIQLISQPYNLYQSNDEEDVQNILINLKCLKSKFEMILKLRNTYGLKLSFDNYENTKRKEKDFFISIFDMVSSDSIIHVLETKGLQFCQEFHMDFNEAVADYLLNLLQNVERDSNKIIPSSPMEHRILILLNYVKEGKKKDEAIKEILRLSATSNSEALESVLKETYSKATKDLKTNFEFHKLKKILDNYGIANANLSDRGILKKIMYNLLNRVHDPSSFDDAVYISEFYNICDLVEVYSFRLKRTILLNRSSTDDMLLMTSTLIEKLKSVDSKVFYKVADKMIAWVSCSMENGYDQMVELKIDFALSMLNHLKKTPESSNKAISYQQLYKDLNNLRDLHKQFSVALSLDQYDNAEKRESVFNSVIERQTLSHKEIQKDLFPSLPSFRKCGRLLLIPQDTVHLVCGRIFIEHGFLVEGIKIISHVMNTISFNSSNTLIFKLTDIFVQFSNLPLITYNGLAPKDLFFCLSQMRWIICQALSINDNVDVLRFLDLFKCYDLLVSTLSECDSIEENQFSMDSVSKDTKAHVIEAPHQYYQEHRVVLDCRSAYSFCHKLLQLNKDLFVQKQSSVTECQDIIKNIVSCTLSIHNYLIANSQQLLSLRFVLNSFGHFLLSQAYVMHSNRGSRRVVSTCDEISDVLSLLSEGLASDLLKNTADQGLCLGFLLPQNKTWCYDNVDRIFMETSRGSLAQAALGYGIFTQSPSLVYECIEMKINSYWIAKLKDINVSVYLKQLNDHTYRESLCYEIILATKGNYTMLMHFARSFSFSKEQCQEITETFVKYSLLCIDEQKQYQRLIDEVVGEVGHEVLSDILYRKCFPLISPYDYSRLKFVLNCFQKSEQLELQMRSRQGLRLLRILSNYDRCGKPEDRENQFLASQIKSMFPNSFSELYTALVKKNFAENVEKRLPVHLLMHKDVDILYNEVHSADVGEICAVAGVIGMETKRFLLSLIDHISKTSKSYNISRLLLITNELQDVDVRLLSLFHIRDSFHSNLEDLLQIYKQAEDYCFHYLDDLKNQGNLNTENEKAINIKHHLEDIKHKKNLVCTKIQLKQIMGMTNEEIEATVKDWEDADGDDATNQKEEYRQQQQQQQQQGEGSSKKLQDQEQKAVKLIRVLYRDYGPGMLDKNDLSLHEISQDISERYEIFFEKLRFYLIQLWLAEPKIDDQEILRKKRIIYLLKKGKTEDNLIFLYNFASQENSKTTFATRLRAVTILLAVYSTTEIEKYTEKAPWELRELVKSILHLQSLEALGISQTFDSLANCNKEGMVRGLWRSKRTDAKAVRLIANLCIDFEIYKPEIWCPILRQLCDFNQIAFLGNVLRYLPISTELRSLSYNLNYWSCTLNIQESKHSKNLKDKYLKQMSLVPAILHADLRETIQTWLDLSDPEMAISLMCLCKHPRHFDRFYKEFVTRGYYLELLVASDIKDSALMTKVQEMTFVAINESQKYEVLRNSKYFGPFVDYLIKTNCIDDLIMTLINSSRQKDAYRLVLMYNKFYSISSPENCTKQEVIDFHFSKEGKLTI